MDKFTKIAHRGYSLIKKKENTLFSFQNAIKHKFDMIELDVHLCKSKDIVIYHDDYIKYKDNILWLKDLTFKEIHKINPYIITLPFFFKNIDKKDIKIYLDIKGDNQIIKPLLEYLNETFEDYDNIILASFNKKCLQDIIRYNKSIGLGNKKYLVKGFITENIFTNVELLILLKDIEYIIVHWTILNKDLIDYCRKKNKKVYCYTCKNVKQLEYIRNFEVDGVVSDILL